MGIPQQRGLVGNPRNLQGIQGIMGVPMKVYTRETLRNSHILHSIGAPVVFGFRIRGRMPWGWPPGFARPQAASKKQAAVVVEVRDSRVKINLSSLSCVR